MKIFLAGYNVDSEVLDELKKFDPSRKDITPETFSASYARISRDPRPVNELRSIARKEVEKAKRSNQNIIFKMGHHSVAEHAVFNFDVIGVSRLAIEEIERFRLGSYTEKSQRYIKLEDDFVISEEIKKAGEEKIFVDTINAQNSLYHNLYKKLKPYMYDTNRDLAKTSRNHSMLDGLAMEDARYVVSLAMKGQLGMTVNARNLEFLIRRFASKELEELKDFNKKIYTLAKEVAPSIILFTEANDYDAKTYEEIKKKATSLIDFSRPGKKEENVRLADYTSEADNKLAAALLHTISSYSYSECIRKTEELSAEEKKALIMSAFNHMEFFDAALREFEYVDLTFDLIVSASCFAQLKRHRMATLTAQKYNPELGVTVPPSVIAVGAENEFMEMIERTNEVYSRLNETIDVGAEYILTNAHRKRVLLKINARELYHVSRLREDSTAQWEIRNVAGEMSRLAKDVMPLTCLLLGGKNAYLGVYEKVFGKKPTLIPPIH